MRTRTILPVPPRDPALKLIDRVMWALAPLGVLCFLLAYFGGR